MATTLLYGVQQNVEPEPVSVMSTSKIPFIQPQYMPMSIARAIWKGKWTVALIWIGVSAGIYVYVSKLPAVYYSEALILVDAPKISSQYVTAPVSTNLQDRLATITRQVLSRSKMAKVIEDVHLWRGPGAVPDSFIEIVRNSVHVTVEKGWSGDQPGAVRVGFDGSDPRMCADVSNRVASLFVEENSKTREIQTEGTAEFLDAQLREVKKKLTSQETTISRYKVEHNGELPQQENALFGMLGRLQTELQANNDKMNRAQANKTMLENTLEVAEATVSALTHAVETGRVGLDDLAAVEKPAAPLRRSETLSKELGQMRLRYNDEHPDIRRIKEEIAVAREAEEAEARQALARVIAEKPAPSSTARKAAASGANAADVAELVKARMRVSSVKAQISAAEEELAARAEEQERIRRNIATVQSRVDRLPIREQEIGGLMRDYDITKQTYESLLGKKVSADMGNDLERRQKSERFNILETAHVPTAPLRPNRLLYNISGSCFGLLLGLGLAFANELRRNVVLGQWELSPDTPILGSLPNIVVEKGRASASKKRSLWRSKLRLMAWSSALSLLALACYVAAKR